MHLIRPETQDWEFRFVPGDQDKDKFLYYLWTHPKLGDAPPSEEDSRRSVVVAYQPPWILSDKDMDEFARVKAVRISHPTLTWIHDFVFPSSPPSLLPDMPLRHR